MQRIKALVIPPAWTDVWICPDPRGHLQATGRDARGRKQYRYHPRWREVRDETKYLPPDRLRAGAAGDPPADGRPTSRKSGLPKEKVLAAVVQLLEKTLIRVGNDEYAKQNRSFGLTTLRDGHVEVSGGNVTFAFRGKSGVEHEVDLDDRRLARVVKACRDLPGQELFQYVDETGKRQTIESADVNGYLREVTGEEFTSKDFRTWAGTVLAAQLLRDFEGFDSDGAGQAEHRSRHRVGGQAAGQHQGGVPQVLHPPGGARLLHGWLDAGDRRAAGATRARKPPTRSRPEKRRCSDCCSGGWRARAASAPADAASLSGC